MQRTVRTTRLVTRIESAQDARVAMFRHGWRPIVRKGTQEHWALEERHAILIWRGGRPDMAPLAGARFVTFSRSRNGRIIPEPSEEVLTAREVARVA